MSFHIAANKDEIADVVLLPGDPLRAKFIAENYLEDISCYNKVRNMFGYTGTYKGKKISVQGAGMGLASTAIYVNELIDDYGVKTIIRVGTCGSIVKDLKPGGIVLAMGANTDSSVNRLKFGGMDYAPIADFGLLYKAFNIAKEKSIEVRVGGIFSTDSFYNSDPDRYKIWAKHGVLGVEMESTVLYTIAARAGVRALSVLTVSDNLLTGEFASADEREKQIEDMTRIALEVVV
jgi:purine-nucleoside phosphorylase